MAETATLELPTFKGRTGWDVREERDDTVVKRVNYSDWHRVERAILVFERSRPEATE